MEHLPPGAQVAGGEVYHPQAGAQEIAQGHEQGQGLSQYGGQRPAGYAHVQGEDENVIQNGVEHRPREGTQHGIGRGPVGPDEVASSGGEGHHGQAEGGNAGVGEGVGQHIGGCAKEQEQRTPEQQRHRPQ